MPPSMAAMNHKAIKPESRPSSGYLIASQAEIAQAFTPMNAAKASRANSIHRFIPDTASKAKLNAIQNKLMNSQQEEFSRGNI
jgi:hypothetical protein